MPELSLCTALILPLNVLPDEGMCRDWQVRQTHGRRLRADAADRDRATRSPARAPSVRSTAGGFRPTAQTLFLFFFIQFAPSLQFRIVGCRLVVAITQDRP